MVLYYSKPLFSDDNKEKKELNYKCVFKEEFLCEVANRKEAFVTMNAFCKANNLNFPFTQITSNDGITIVEFSSAPLASSLNTSLKKYHLTSYNNCIRFVYSDSPLTSVVHSANVDCKNIIKALSMQDVAAERVYEKLTDDDIRFLTYQYYLRNGVT